MRLTKFCSSHGLFTVLALVGAGPGSAQAQSGPAVVHALPPVTVSASPLDQPADGMATPAAVLAGRELAQHRGATLGETLGGLPGIAADTFGGGASRPVIRGQAAPRVAVVSDGAELMDASGVSPDHAVTIEPLLARRIEVLRGPATLRYGGGAIGGVVNVLDDKVPRHVPEDGFEGEAELRGATGTGERAGAVGITAGQGNLAVRVEAAARESDDYRVPHWHGSRLEGSYNRTATGTLGLSWVTARGYAGAAFTYERRRYGLPGHGHEYESCHPHGSHLHCGGHGHGHDHDDDHGHDHDGDHGHGAGHGVPRIDLHSRRFDLRGQYREPLAGFEQVRWRAGFTDYYHDEIEGGEPATRFAHRGFDARVEWVHRPVLGWHGVIGLQGVHGNFGASGEEAFLPDSRRDGAGIFVLEEYRWGDWRFEVGARQDWQRIRAAGGRPEVRMHGTSVSAAAVWAFAPRYSVALSLSRSQRLPTAQELFADGVHLATRTYETGNPGLGKETSHNVALTLRKTEGATTFDVSVFHNRVKDYIYARTLDRHEDFRLIEYAQHDAVFSGVEGEMRHRFSPVFSAAVFGDHVRGRLAGSANLPRMPAARLGVRGNVTWGRWSGELEYYRVFAQHEVAAYESPSPGYHMVDAWLAYDLRIAAADAQVWLRGTNLLNKLAYNHASFLAGVAPLPGRSMMLGFRASF